MRMSHVMASPTTAHLIRRSRPLLVMLFLVILGRLLTRRVRVSGDSMTPALEDGDRLLAVPVLRARVGDIILLTDPRCQDRLLVKRLESTARGDAWVAGDNADGSTDSRHFGPVHAGAPWWVVVWRYAPLDRMGTIPRAAPARQRTQRWCRAEEPAADPSAVR